MKTIQTAILGLMVAAVAAYGDAWNKKTEITFQEAVEIPGKKILQPGNYVLKLMDSSSNRHIVQIFNQEENQVHATILAIPKYREQPAEDTIVTFYEAPGGEPVPIRAWFYPGDQYGQEFAYPRERARTIAARTGEKVPEAEYTDEGELAQATPPATQEPRGGEAAVPPPATRDPELTEESGRQETLAEDNAGFDEPVLTAQARRPENEPFEQTSELPQTASPLPLLGVLGTLALAGGLALRKWRRK